MHVICDLDHCPPKSREVLLSPWLTCLPSLMKMHTTVWIYHVHFNICDYWPSPLTSKINRTHPVIMVNMSTKFDEDPHTVQSIIFTRLFAAMTIVTLTSKINRIHPLIYQVWWRGIQQYSLYHHHKVRVCDTHGLIDGTTAVLLYDHCNVLHGDKKNTHTCLCSRTDIVKSVYIPIRTALDN